MQKLILTNLVHPDTRNRTIIMAGNDLGRVERLLNFTRLNHPGRSEQWYWDKVLYDLERDRN
jgi:hypothetical protein